MNTEAEATVIMDEQGHTDTDNLAAQKTTSNDPDDKTQPVKERQSTLRQDPDKEPTQETYYSWQYAFDFFNRELFSDTLPSCLITYQRKKSSMGYFSPDRFIDSEGGKTDEIALNPTFFAIRGIIDAASTLVHEMVHLWQYHDKDGKHGRRGYHNTQWAKKMESIGLYPSATGRPGGKRTGDRVSHYIVKDGLFAQKAAILMRDEKFQVRWVDRFVSALPSTETLVYPAPDTAKEAKDQDELDEQDKEDQGEGETGTQSLTVAKGNEPLSDSVTTETISTPDDNIVTGKTIIIPGYHDEDAQDVNLPTYTGYMFLPPDTKKLSDMDIVLPEPADKKNRSNRSKYICPACKVKLWGKPGLKIGCLKCNSVFEENNH